MKRLILSVALIATLALGSCTSDSAFEKGKAQLEQQGYTEVQNTGYQWFCCDKNDNFSTGFKCKNAKGEWVEGCFCSGILKGVTVRFQ